MKNLGLKSSLICLLIFNVCRAQVVFTGTIMPRGDSLLPAYISLPELHKTTVANSHGEFSMMALPEGVFNIVVLRPGYKAYSGKVTLGKQQPGFFLEMKEAAGNLQEVVVLGEQQSNAGKTANSIEVMPAAVMRQQGAMNLSDALAKLPGISQLSTGAGISKPVIRGLYGNRIQTVLLGIRFDNQQWQDEHGLGLTDLGIDRVEVIKGTATLFYGSEAMGGVVNIINEKPAHDNKLQADLNTRYFSNTNGYGIDAAVKKSYKNFYFIVRAGQESHGDYSDGNKRRILNSRFQSNGAKATLGFRRGFWASENNYLFGQSYFGFLMDAYQQYEKSDTRWSRDFSRPHHAVLIHIFSSQNTFALRASKLKLNVGAHWNNRDEQEGSSGISLSMFLQTYALMGQWQKQLAPGLELVIGSQNQYQINTNNGSRIIVPDAKLAESSLFAYIKKEKERYAIEGGLRYDLKNIVTDRTGTLNNGDPFSPGYTVVPVSRIYNVVNGSFGASFFDSRHYILKANISSGYRAPNLAELSSNGLHEGSVRYEVGNVNLKTEQNLCGNVYAELYNTSISIYADAYINHFLNYIYLQRDSAKYIGFSVYKYIQNNADIKGLEGGIKLRPAFYKPLNFRVAYSGINGRTEKGEDLPFIPAQKLSYELKLQKGVWNQTRNLFVSFNFVQVLVQNKPGPFETATPAYHLLNVSAGGEHYMGANKLVFSVAVNNITNEVYYDHLSRFKNFGINNMGRNMALQLKYQFN